GVARQLAQPPSKVRVMMETAEKIEEAMPERAARLYAKLLEEEPRNFDALMRLAAIQLRRGDFNGAVRHLLNAATSQPDNAEPHLKLGELYRERGDSEAAATSFRRAIQYDADSLEAHRNLAELYEELGRR